jgi:HEAT repeat protein
LKKTTYWSDEGRAKLLLTKIKDPDAIEPLIALLNDKDANVIARGIAAHSLAKIEDNRVVEPLIAALKNKNRWVREQAASSLGAVRNPRAVEPLIAALKEKKYLREAAAKALKKITGEDFDYFAHWDNWWKKRQKQDKNEFSKEK